MSTPQPALSRGARTLIRHLLAGTQAEDDFRDSPNFFRELERQGLLGPDGRPTPEAEARRREFVPNDGLLSEGAVVQLKRHLAGDNEVTDANRVTYRELAMAGLMAACHTFVGGDESAYRLTKEGFERKGEWLKG